MLLKLLLSELFVTDLPTESGKLFLMCPRQGQERWDESGRREVGVAGAGAWHQAEDSPELFQGVVAGELLTKDLGVVGQAGECRRIVWLSRRCLQVQRAAVPDALQYLLG